MLGEPSGNARKKEQYKIKASEITNFLERIRHEIRGLGLAPRERAIHFAATTVLQTTDVYRSAIREGLKLDAIEVERSPLCRPKSDCWDVKLFFFEPTKRLEQAREVYRLTVDVSDVVPAKVGNIRQWDTF